MPTCRISYKNDIYEFDGIYGHVVLLGGISILGLSLVGAMAVGELALKLEMNILTWILDTFVAGNQNKEL